MNKYTEEDLRKAFYKGREQSEEVNSIGVKPFVRPTFNGYLREIGEKPEKEEESLAFLKWIFLFLAVFNYGIFCFDVEYHRDVMTWVWLGTAFAFTYLFHVIKK